MYIAATLVTVYSKCSSSLEDFKKVCSVVMTCDHIAWNAVIAGYSNLGRHEEALRCFHEMKQADIDIDSYTLTSMVGAIGNSSFLEEGKAMHARQNWLYCILECSKRACFHVCEMWSHQ